MANFINKWTGKTETWNPETGGYFALVFAAGWTGTLNDGKILSLENGSVGTPHAEKGQADFAWLKVLEKWPEAKLQLVKLPCVFSNRGSWINISDVPDPELAEQYEFKRGMLGDLIVRKETLQDVLREALSSY